jgi:hypothetical protein
MSTEQSTTVRGESKSFEGAVQDAMNKFDLQGSDILKATISKTWITWGGITGFTTYYVELTRDPIETMPASP